MRHPRNRETFFISLLLVLALVAPSAVHAQTGQEVSPSGALSSMLIAACRQNETEFAQYLTAYNSAAFEKLSADQRKALLRRLSLLDDPGRPLVSSDPQNHTVLRCESSSATVEYRFGDERIHENLASIPMRVVDGNATEFGLVREGGGWRLLSLGLLLFDIPQLSKKWAQEDLAAREDAAVKTLRELADIITRYRNTFEKLPESLAQLGPPDQDGVSPEAADLIPKSLASGTYNGYRLRYRILPAPNGGEPGFEIAAAPIDYGKTGKRSFFLDAEGKLHAADHQGESSTADDPLASTP
jgi:hypothetical protein